MISNNSAKRLRPEELHVDQAMQPEWTPGHEKPIAVGDVVLCTAGLASVTKVRGKTGDGSRLLELKLVEGDQHPFYAAASNVLVRPGEVAQP